VIHLPKNNSIILAGKFGNNCKWIDFINIYPVKTNNAYRPTNKSNRSTTYRTNFF
jgi:hypothetical protein